MDKIYAISNHSLEIDIFSVWIEYVRLSPQVPPMEIDEGVSEEQDSLNTIFNTHKIRIVCKIWSSYFIVHARARSF